MTLTHTTHTYDMDTPTGHPYLAETPSLQFRDFHTGALPSTPYKTAWHKLGLGIGT